MKIPWLAIRREIYIDVPYDENELLYVQVPDYLENPDGTMRFDTMSFWHLSLKKAMENAHHDEPDFWEKGAADFWVMSHEKTVTQGTHDCH